MRGYFCTSYGHGLEVHLQNWKTGIERCNMILLYPGTLHLVLHLAQSRVGVEVRVRLQYAPTKTECDSEETITVLGRLKVLEKRDGKRDMSRILMIGEEKRGALEHDNLCGLPRGVWHT
jgi:hypothetical protein